MEKLISQKSLVASGQSLVATIYSDYAHHPTEIKATIQALREKHPLARLVVVFQPHQQDRLTRLFKEFTRAFAGVDNLVLMPTYRVAGRDDTRGKDAFALAQEIAARGIDAAYAKDMREALRLVSPDLAASRSVVVFMGAGDIDAQARATLAGVDN